MDMIDTIVGPLPAAELTVTKTTQQVACGTARTTSYYYHGALVKQDVDIDVDTALVSVGETGEF